MVGNLKKVSKGLVLALCSTLILASCSPASKDNSVAPKDGAKQIGIIQHLQHPALDSANKGFIKALEDKGYKDGDKIKLIQKNAQGEIVNNDPIAKKFTSDKVDLIYAIATPSAQAALNSTKEIPIVFTAVTDPVDAKLVKSLDKPETNATGASDMAPIRDQLSIIKKIKPNAKKVGFLYNAGEANSVVQAKEAKKICAEFGYELIEQTITTSNDAAQATDILASKVDVIYVPTDNMVVSAGAVVAEKALAKKVPLISAEGSVVENGGLLSEGLDYFKLGYEAGLMAVDILEGKSKPQDMPVKIANKFTLTVNKKTLEKIGMKLPKDLESKATFVGGEK
ncbi:MAG: ABC transporter substrate-binding protein [Clostridium sp.]